MSALLNPWLDLQITLHKCQEWLDYVQCLCLTKVGSSLRSQSKIKHCMTVLVFRVCSISFESLVELTNNITQMSSIMRLCEVLMLPKVGSRSRLQSNIKLCMTVFRVRSISFTNYFAQLSAMIRRCAVLMFDQGRFNVKVTV